MKDFFMRLTWVDYVVTFALLRGCYVGYREGIFPEILRIASYLITILATFYFYTGLGQWITLKTFFNNATATMIAFTALLLAGLVICKLIRVLLLKMLKVGEGGVPLRLVGLLLGGVRWLFLLSFIFMLIDHSPLAQLKKDIHTRSVVGGRVSQIGPLVFDYMSHISPQLGLPEKK